MYPTEPFVRAVLAPHEPAICDLIHSSWQQVRSSPHLSDLIYKRSVAVLMHQFLMNNIKGTFGGSSVRLMEGHETIRLLIDKTILLRLKKMDRRGYTRAIQTQACLAFTNISPRLPFYLSQVPDLAVVDMGYVLNDLETKIEHILVAARFGESVIWSYAAEEGGTEANAKIAPAPKLPATSGNIIRLRADARKRDKK